MNRIKINQSQYTIIQCLIDFRTSSVFNQDKRNPKTNAQSLTKQNRITQTITAVPHRSNTVAGIRNKTWNCCNELVLYVPPWRRVSAHGTCREGMSTWSAHYPCEPTVHVFTPDKIKAPIMLNVVLEFQRQLKYANFKSHLHHQLPLKLYFFFKLVIRRNLKKILLYTFRDEYLINRF